MILLHAHLHIMYYHCIKFRWNPSNRLGGVALTRYMDGRTDGQGDSYIPHQTLFAGGIIIGNCHGCNRYVIRLTSGFILLMQSTPITTKVVSSNPAHGRGVLDTALCNKVCLWLTTGRWCSLCTTVSSTNKTDCHINWNVAESGIKHHNPNPNFTDHYLLNISYLCSLSIASTSFMASYSFWSSDIPSNGLDFSVSYRPVTGFMLQYYNVNTCTWNW